MLMDVAAILRTLRNSKHANHTAAADLLTLHAHTVSFFSSRSSEYRSFKSEYAEVGAFGGSGGGGVVHSEPYDNHYLWGTLSHWCHDSTLGVLGTGADMRSRLYERCGTDGVALPEISSCYAPDPTGPPLRLSYSLQHRRQLINFLSSGGTSGEWPFRQSSSWVFRDLHRILGSPLFDFVLLSQSPESDHTNRHPVLLDALVQSLSI